MCFIALLYRIVPEYPVVLAANRDESIFGEPEGFRLDRNPSMNMLYGADSLLSGSLTDKT